MKNKTHIDYLKQYNFLKHNLFNYWSLLFYNKYIYYFFNFFFKKGKKILSIKLIYALLFLIKKKVMISPILVLQSALLNYRHILKLKILRYRRKKMYSYVLLSLQKQVKVSVQYLAEQFGKFNISNSKYSFLEKLSVFILNLFFKTPLIYGRFLQSSSNAHKLVQENQRFSKNKKKKINKRSKRNKNKKKTKLSSFVNKRSRLRQNRTFWYKFGKFKKPLRVRFKYKLKPRRRIFIKKKKLNTGSRQFYNEYTSTLRNLYTDFHNTHDILILPEGNINRTYKTHFINHSRQRPLFFNKMFLYVILGKSYSLLENVYNAMTFPFWQLYAIRAKLFVNKLHMQSQNVHGQTEQANFFKDLNMHLQKSRVKLGNRHSISTLLKTSSPFQVDEFNLVDTSIIHSYLTILSKFPKKSLLQSRMQISHAMLSSAKNVNLSKAKKVRRQLRGKKLLRHIKKKTGARRIFTRVLLRTLSKNKSYNRSQLNRIYKGNKLYKINKIRRIHVLRRNHLRISYLRNLTKHYYLLLRFRLLRTVWRLIRSVVLRKILRRRKRKSLVSTRVLTYVK